MSLDSEIVVDLPWSHHHLALASGYTDTDLTGNGRDLILQNDGVNAWSYQDDALPNGDLALGKHVTNALYFTAPGLARAANTVEWWFKFHGSTFGGQDGTVGSGGPPIRLVFNQGSGVLEVVTNAGTTAISPTILPDNTAFHHFAITNNGSGTFQVYYDGALVWSASGVSEGAIDGDSFFAGIPGFGYYCPGKWAQDAQYDYVLGGTRILAHYTAGSTAAPVFSSTGLARLYTRLAGGASSNASGGLSRLYTRLGGGAERVVDFGIPADAEIVVAGLHRPQTVVASLHPIDIVDAGLHRPTVLNA